MTKALVLQAAAVPFATLRTRAVRVAAGSVGTGRVAPRDPGNQRAAGGLGGAIATALAGQLRRADVFACDLADRHEVDALVQRSRQKRSRRTSSPTSMRCPSGSRM